MGLEEKKAGNGGQGERKANGESQSKGIFYALNDAQSMAVFFYVDGQDWVLGSSASPVGWDPQCSWG